MQAQEDLVVLFSDDFSAYPVCERLDAPEFRAGLGPWRQTTLHYSWHSERIRSHRDCPLPWSIAEIDGRRFLEQPESFFNVVLKAGDPLWRDYVLELQLAVDVGPAGPIVRYHTSRQNYWVAFEPGQPVRLIRRDQDDHVTLGTSTDLTVEAGRLYACRVTCDGARLTVEVDAEEVISVEDDSYPRGEIALRTEGPARFAAVKVLATPDEKTAVEASRQRAQARLAVLRGRVPKAKLIHSVHIPVPADYVHVQDVNDDGRPEIIAIEAQIPKADYIRLARMSVFDWDGKLLWQIGEQRESKYRVHGDIAFNIADIDGDGRTEILITHEFEILILDGATGEVKRRTPTPLTYMGREDLYERTVGDSFLVCNLRGLNSPQDFVLKDRYRNLWAYTCDLKPLWHRSLNTGHYVRARDINGDGRDEIMAGYSMLNSDGFTLWTVPGGEPDYNRYPGSLRFDADRALRPW